MANVKSDDCLLVGREGVDYKVSYEDFVESIEASIDIPDAPELSEYAKLDDGSQTITAAAFVGDGSGLTNVPGGDISLDAYAKLDDSDQVITAKNFIGEGGRITNVSAVDSERLGSKAADLYVLEDNLDSRLTEYSKLTDASQSITAQKFIGDGSQVTSVSASDSAKLGGKNASVYALSADVNSQLSAKISHATTDGKYYTSKDGGWVEALKYTAGSGIKLEYSTRFALDFASLTELS